MWKKVLIFVLGWASVASPAALGACPQKSSDKPRLERRGEQPRPKDWLSRQVGHQLRMLAYYSVFDNLEYRLNGYRVELLGQVVRPTLKSDAEAAVERIEGVEAVVNHIEVLPLSFNDDRIRRATYRAIYFHPVLQRYALQPVPPIHIIVKNGNVTLVGVVASEMDKNVANLQANSVAGAFSVTNRLRVEERGNHA